MLSRLTFLLFLKMAGAETIRGAADAGVRAKKAGGLRLAI
jgi:hypothetical protein